MSVYEEVLGDAYPELAENLQRLHRESFSAIGEMTVTGRKWARFLGLPSLGYKAVVMTVREHAGEEIWDRSFLPAFPVREAEDSRLHHAPIGWQQPAAGIWSKVTRQQCIDGLLEERIGPMVFKFRLRVVHGFLVFEQVSSRFLGIPVPKFLGMKIWAIEIDSGTHFSPLVSFHLPLIGCVCTYAGSIEYPWTSQSGSSSSKLP